MITGSENIKRTTRGPVALFLMLFLAALVIGPGCGDDDTPTGQAPIPTWQQVISGTLDETPTDLLLAASGGIRLLAFEESGTAATNFVAIYALSADGTILWREFGPDSGAVFPTAFCEAGSDNFMYVGAAIPNGPNAPSPYAVVGRQGPAGPRWMRADSGVYPDALEGIVTITDSTFLAIGHTLQSDTDVVAVGLNAAGSIAWTSNLGTAAVDDFATDLAAGTAGDFYVSGFTGSGSSNEALVIKIDGSGNESWRVTFSGLQSARALGVTATSDGGCAVVGISSLPGTPVTGQLWAARLGAGGGVTWDTVFTSPGQVVGQAIDQSLNGGFIITGWSLEPGGATRDIALVKLDADGRIAWQTGFDGGLDDVGRVVAATPDGGYLVGARGGLIGLGGDDIWLLKTDPDGIPGPFLTP